MKDFENSSYRQKIQEQHDNLSPSYRRLADFVMGRYYDVAFMTAAQLAGAVDVDTTTVVRFSQRLGYPGYPDLLQDIRSQVREELYAVYEPAPLDSNDPAVIFKTQIDQESANLRQILVHNPPGRLQTLVTAIASARRVLFAAEGEAVLIAQMAANYLHQRGMAAAGIGADPRQQAVALSRLAGGDVVVGVCGGEEELSVARCLAFAQAKGCRTAALLGKLDGQVIRWADEVLHIPAGPTVSSSGLVALTGAAMALVRAVSAVAFVESEEDHQRDVQDAYRYLTEQSTGPDQF